jgi:hypothetical protein
VKQRGEKSPAHGRLDSSAKLEFRQGGRKEGVTSQVEARANFVTGFREDRRVTPQEMLSSMSRAGKDRCFEDSNFRAAIEDASFEEVS